MLRDDAVALIKARLGNRTDSALDAQIVTEMIYVQENILEGAVQLPWFLIAENATIQTRPHEERIPLPMSPLFLREVDEAATDDAGALFRYSQADDEEGPWVPLRKGDYGNMLVKYPQEGRPLQYDLLGDYFRLKPTPDAQYTLRMLYYGRETSLSTGNIENKWLKWCGDLLIAHTGYNVATKIIGDSARAQVFAADLSVAVERAAKVFEAREHVGRTYHMGEKP